MKDNQELSQKWWNSLSYDDQIWEMMKAGYEKRYPETLSKKEIEELWIISK